MASLTIIVDGTEQRYPLDSAAVTLGRGLESDIRLKDIKASRRHCQIVKTTRGYQCVDLSSGNGTYVNGVQIKTQMLDGGDKITIGSTTISFEDAAKGPPPAKPVSSKGPTAKLPVVSASAPASAKTATGKIGAGVQAPATRKSTVKVEAVKSASQALKPVSQGALKPVSQGGLKPATQPVSKSASRLGKPVSGTRGTRPRPATPEAGPKKSPVLLIAIAVGVLALGGGAAWYFTRDGADQVGVQINQLIKKAETAEKEEKFAAAVADYRKALELCQGDRYKYQARDIAGRLKHLEARPGGDAPKTDPAPKEPEKGLDLQAKRMEISDKYKLAGDPAAADWSGAVKEWTDLSKGKPAGDLKSKIDVEIKAIHAKAKQDLDRLRKKAETLAQENKMAEAVDILKQQKPRFEHTDLYADLDAAIKQHEK